MELALEGTGCYYVYDCVYNSRFRTCCWSGRVVCIQCVEWCVCFVGICGRGFLYEDDASLCRGGLKSERI